jgi:preprotein translocase subunit SecG
METFVTVIHVCTAIFMILVVLVQGGNSGGVGAAFGGGNSQGVFGAAGATSFLGKLTYGMAAIFMVTSISLSTLQGTAGKTGLKERLQQKAEETKGAEPKTDAKPATEQPAAPATPQP